MFMMKTKNNNCSNHYSIVYSMVALKLFHTMLMPLQAGHLRPTGSIADGSIWFLKGAARIQTAIAVIVAFEILGKQARCYENQKNPCGKVLQ